MCRRANPAEITTGNLIKIDIKMFKRGFFCIFLFLCIRYSTRFICRPLDSIVSEDAGIKPRTVETTALAVRCSNYSARSHPHSVRSHPRSARSHPDSPRPHPHSARSHVDYGISGTGEKCTSAKSNEILAQKCRT